MRSDRTIQGAMGRITTGIEPNQTILSIIEYVYDKLAQWRDDPDRPPEQSENRLNAHLCKFLDSRARKEFAMFRFDREEHQVVRRNADLSASATDSITIGARQYSIYDPLLIIECKRLPAPSRDREREYVTGGETRSGGIQRFKLGLYAGSHEVAALIAYAQNNKFNFWQNAINAWIDDLVSGTEADTTCVWQSGEELGELSEDAAKGTARCRSSHTRDGNTGNPAIVLHHLWVKMPE